MIVLIKIMIGLGMAAATAAIMMVAWWATSYGIEGTFAFLSVMWVAAYIWIEIRHKGIKERNRIRRQRLANGKHPETGRPL